MPTPIARTNPPLPTRIAARFVGAGGCSAVFGDVVEAIPPCGIVLADMFTTVGMDACGIRSRAAGCGVAYGLWGCGLSWTQFDHWSGAGDGRMRLEVHHGLDSRHEDHSAA